MNQRELITDLVSKINCSLDALKHLPEQSEELHRAIESLDEAEQLLCEARSAIPVNSPFVCPECGGTELRLDQWIGAYNRFEFEDAGDGEYVVVWSSDSQSYDDEGYAYGIHCDNCDRDWSDEELAIIVEHSDLNEFTKVGYPTFIAPQFAIISSKLAAERAENERKRGSITFEPCNQCTTLRSPGPVKRDGEKWYCFHCGAHGIGAQPPRTKPRA